MTATAWELRPAEAVIQVQPPLVAAVAVSTGLVETLKAAIVDPAGTVTVGGTVAFELFEERFTIVSEG